MKAFFRATLPVIALMALIRIGLPARQTAAQTQEIKGQYDRPGHVSVTAPPKLLNDKSIQSFPARASSPRIQGGSPDVRSSHTRVDRFTAELKDKWGVEIVGSVKKTARKSTPC